MIGESLLLLGRSSGFVERSHLIYTHVFPNTSICLAVSVSIFLGSWKAPGVLWVLSPDALPTPVLLGHIGIVLCGPLCMTLVQGETAAGSYSTSLLGTETGLKPWCNITAPQFPTFIQTM